GNILHRQPGARLQRRVELPEPALRAARRADRHGDRRAAGHRAGGHHLAAVADHLRTAGDHRHHHAGRHLLRRAVRRFHHGHPAQPARRDILGRHHARRLQDGAQRARRRRARHRGDLVLLRRHGRHRARRRVRPVADAGGAVLRPGRLLLAHAFRPDHIGRAGPGQRAQVGGDGGARRGARPGRHRRADRPAALHLRHPRVVGRHQLRGLGHGRVRHRRDHLEPGAAGSARGPEDQGGEPLLDQRGVEARHAFRAARHGAGLRARHPAGRRRLARRLWRLHDGAQGLEGPGQVRHRRDRGRGGAGSGQQRRGADLLHPAADARHPGQRGDGADGGRAHHPGHPAGAAHGGGPTRPVLGPDLLHVDRQRDAAGHQPAADRHVGEAAPGALQVPLSRDPGVLLHRRLQREQQRLRRVLDGDVRGGGLHVQQAEDGAG
ncbi:MAG: Tripartite tricarboxylate transporter TctA family, partial [uncultured Acetobacteraceae bacterium]